MLLITYLLVVDGCRFFLVIVTQTLSKRETLSRLKASAPRDMRLPVDEKKRSLRTMSGGDDADDWLERLASLEMRRVEAASSLLAFASALVVGFLLMVTLTMAMIKV
jgi:hypothetical protein